jgi:spore coat polysaccharide biosynthesis predicted glycosyltransferase SpsG
MDINLCVDQLGLNANYYTLNQGNAPHEIVSWDGPDPQPTQSVLEAAWADIEADEDYQVHVADNSKAYPVAA